MPLVGMKYSPGGSVLPNKCAPFDASKNNPYAIRCIDAMPSYETHYAGDDICIMPPAPGLGIQVGVHPGGMKDYWEKMWAGDYSVYDDSEATAPYELAAGGETTQDYTAWSPLTEQRHFYRTNYRGRYGSHHSGARFSGRPLEKEGWASGADLNSVIDSVLGGGARLVDVQRAYTDVPNLTLDVPPEEVDLGYPALPGSVTFNLHHFNSTEAPLLREIWVNIWWVPSDQVKRVPVEGIHFGPTIAYPPGQVTTLHSTVMATGETQLYYMFGHRHAWTTRFYATLARAGTSEADAELVYDSYDWFDMPTFSFNTRTQNPALNPSARVDGAKSGPITLQAGDVIHFYCRAETTKERADQLGVEPPTQTLRFANEAFTGEMCLLNTSSTGARLQGSGGFGF